MALSSGVVISKTRLSSSPDRLMLYSRSVVLIPSPRMSGGAQEKERELSVMCVAARCWGGEEGEVMILSCFGDGGVWPTGVRYLIEKE